MPKRNLNKVDLQLLCNFIDIALQDGFSPVTVLHIFRTPIYKSTYGGIFLIEVNKSIGMKWANIPCRVVIN